MNSENVSRATTLLEASFRPVLALATAILPHVIRATAILKRTWKRLPADEAQIIIGIIFCFFGGLYPALFAAIQAIKIGGWSTFQGAMNQLSMEVTVILEASKKDDENNKDKKEDEKTYMMRKLNIVLTKVNPEKVDEALGSLYKIWATVIATLSIKFARTIAMAVTLSNDFQKTIIHYAGPTIVSAVPKGYERWVPVVIGWLAKSIAISLAWSIQTIISACTSALEGGLMVTRSLLRILVRKGMKLGGLIPERHEDTYIDEVCGYLLASVGLYFQFRIGFDISFPFNLVLLPFEAAESYLRWVTAK